MLPERQLQSRQQVQIGIVGGSPGLVPTTAEVQRSTSLACGVCLEPVLAKRGVRFGLLEGCDHVFCLPCLREWRKTHDLRPEVARSCPECRAPSHFVTPSLVHLTGERKRRMVVSYLEGMRTIPCHHFNFGEGTCPFGSSCFYAHVDRTGRQVVIEARKAYGKDGGTVLPSYRLSEYLFPEERDTRALLDAIPMAAMPDAESAAGSGTTWPAVRR